MIGARNARKVVIVAVVAAAAGAPGQGASAVRDERAPAALLVAGIRHFKGGAMRTGLEELELASSAAPGWVTARKTLAFALLRSGLFDRSSEELVSLIGRATVRALESGELAASDLAPGLDPDLVGALAVVRHETGRYREADRLYRGYADLVGHTSPEAASAYYRLATMLEESAVPWGDARSERAKALAIDPAAATAVLLPDLPDPAKIPEAEPYVRPIAEAPGHPQPEEGYDSLPELIRWIAAGEETTKPPGESAAGQAEAPGRERAPVEILVGANGEPEAVILPEGIDEGSGPGAAIKEAALRWAFEPAVVDGEAAPAWIVFEVEVPAASASPSDSLTPEEPDAGGVPEMEVPAASASPSDSLAPEEPDAGGIPKDRGQREEAP